ncbi:hypothetical protein ACSBR1_013815 [Camellia fascicularis]
MVICRWRTRGGWKDTEGGLRSDGVRPSTGESPEVGHWPELATHQRRRVVVVGGGSGCVSLNCVCGRVLNMGYWHCISLIQVEIRINAENILEEWDPQYDAMLGPMVGRIRSKPGGKLEMGEASVVDKNNRPMPKLRNTSPESSRYEERPVPPETLNVAQLRHITLPHQGKADDNNGHMDITKIADKFRIDVVQIQRSSNLFRCLRRTAAKREMVSDNYWLSTFQFCFTNRNFLFTEQ